MVRPRKKRRIRSNPEVLYFKPRGIPLNTLKEVILTHEEVEALRLYHILDLDQTESANRLGVSQSTFHRTLSSAQQKIAQAIINGKAIRINI